MRDQLQHRWEDVQAAALAASAFVLLKLRARQSELIAAALLVLFFCTAAGLTLRAGIVGLAAVLLWALAWPAPDGDRRDGSLGRRQSATSDDELWRAVVDAVPEPAVVLNGSAQILHTNRLVDVLFGARRRGSHLASLSRDPELLDAVDRTLATGQPSVVELHERVPVERRLLVTVAPLGLSDQARSTPALLVSFRDLTEQDRLDRMRVDFVANASHELRTPLASLKGFVETLQGAAKDDPEARKRFLKVMSEQAERMTRLIDDLLSLSRVEMREHLPPVEQVDVGDVVGHVIQALQPLAAKASTVIETEGFDWPARIRGDRDEVVQLFQNLIQNAIKYGKRGGRIVVRMERRSATDARQPQVLVSVSDDGPGIAPQHLPRLTERFYRVNAATSREIGGTGLGLAIVKHVLNRHGGELAITSKLGQGSTFAVSLPAAREPAANS